jgi:hypothetical protein
MAETTPGAIMRQLQEVQAGMKKARQAMASLRGEVPSAQAIERVLRLGWESLAAAQRLLAAIPLEAATEPVMSRQIAVQRYAAALLVRLRRLRRGDSGAAADEDSDESDP